MRRSRWQRVLGGLLASAALATACVGDDRPVVTVEEVRPGDVTQTVTAPSRVEAAAREEVAAGVAGEVVGIDAADGAEVTAGQVVVRLSSPQVDVAQEQAAAARDAAGGAGGGISLPVASSGAGSGLQLAQQVVDALDATTRPALADARAKARKIRKEDEREAALAAIAAAEHAYEQSRTALLSSGRVAAGQQQAITGQIQSALAQAASQAAAPARAQAEAAVAAADAQAELLTVEAPFAGTLSLASGGGGGGAAAALPSDLGGLAGVLPQTQSSGDGSLLRVGAQVAPGQVLFTVYDLTGRYANAEVDEVDIPQVQVGQRARVRVDAVEGAFQGVVERIAIEATTTEAGGAGYQVRIRVVGPEVSPTGGPPDAADPSDLRVGMTGSVEIETRTQSSDLVVPSRALLRRGDTTVVLVVRDGVATEVPVEVLALGEDAAAVSAELETGDDVIVEGYEDLLDGAAVRVS